MADRIVLAGMKFFAYHGVLPIERSTGQEFVVDVELEADLSEAARADDLEHTVDYSRVYDIVWEIMQAEPRQLLETVADAIARQLLTLDRVQAATVRVRKPQVRLPGPLDYSSVEIRRARRR
ncbi:MAG TPA: dihydroneopterin aldolase [bacterium]|nr:dihydroneopterin aldolase [bacterium]